MTACYKIYNETQITYRKNVEFLGAFAKLWKATINFVMYVCPFVHPYGKTQLPMNGFS